MAKAQQMETVVARLSMGSENCMVTELYEGRPEVTPAEFHLLEQLHGPDTVKAVRKGEPVERDPAEERERLNLRYRSPDAQATFARCFPGVTAPIPNAFAEIGVDISGIPAPAIAAAKAGKGGAPERRDPLE